MHLLNALAVESTTSTTAVRRIVGEPLPSGVVLAAGLALLALIIAAGLVARSRARRPPH